MLKYIKCQILLLTTLFYFAISLDAFESEASPRIWTCVTRPSRVHVRRVWARDYEDVSTQLDTKEFIYHVHCVNWHSLISSHKGSPGGRTKPHAPSFCMT